jgi:hypothetical protein
VFQSGSLRGGPPPRSSDGTWSIRNLGDRVIDITAAGAHALDLLVRARRWAAEPKNRVAAIGE